MFDETSNSNNETDSRIVICWAPFDGTQKNRRALMCQILANTNQHEDIQDVLLKSECLPSSRTKFRNIPLHHPGMSSIKSRRNRRELLNMHKILYYTYLESTYNILLLFFCTFSVTRIKRIWFYLEWFVACKVGNHSHNFLLKIYACSTVHRTYSTHKH